MYKILATTFTFALCLFAGTAMANDLQATLDITGGAALSSGVDGTYWADAATTQFVISDRNSKGRKAYYTGSNTTSIFVADCAADPCGTSTADLITTAPTDFSTYAFPGTVLGSGS